MNTTNHINYLSRKYDYFFLLCTGVAYFLLIKQYIDAVDDIMYSYVRENSHINWNHPVKNLFDVILSQSNDYLERNGRFVAHSIVQLFKSSTIGAYMFFILSSIVFVLLQLGIMRLYQIISNRNYNPILTLFLLFVLLPDPGHTYIGNIAFTVNYLYSSTLMVWTLYWFHRISTEKTIISHRNIYITIFLGATMHEGFSVPLSVFFLYYIIKHRKSISRPLVYFIIIYWIGAALTVLAPANFNRLGETNYLVGAGESFFTRARMVLLGLIKGEYLVQLFLGISILAFILRKNCRPLLHPIYPFIFIGLLSLCFDVLIAYIGSHQLVPIALMATLIFSYIISNMNFLRKKSVRIIINFILLIIMSIVYINVYDARKTIKVEWDNLHQTAAIKDVEYIDASKLIEACESPEDIIQRFTSKRDLMLHIQSKHFFEKLSSVKATAGANPDKIKAILPQSRERIQQLCMSQSPISENLYESNGYYILRINKDDSNVESVNYIYKSGLAGKTLTRLGRKPIINNYPILWNAHTFQDSMYKYAPVFIDPARVDSIYVK